MNIQNSPGTEMPSSYAVGRTDADSPGGRFLLQRFAVCMGLEDEAAVDCEQFQTLVLCLQSSSASLLWKDIHRER